MLRKYEYHRMLLCLLGKHECKKLVREGFFVNNNDVMKERDYVEALKEKNDMEIQSEAFGFNHTLSI